MAVQDPDVRAETADRRAGVVDRRGIGGVGALQRAERLDGGRERSLRRFGQRERRGMAAAHRRASGWGSIGWGGTYNPAEPNVTARAGVLQDDVLADVGDVLEPVERFLEGLGNLLPSKDVHGPVIAPEHVCDRTPVDPITFVLERDDLDTQRPEDTPRHA